LKPILPIFYPRQVNEFYPAGYFICVLFCAFFNFSMNKVNKMNKMDNMKKVIAELTAMGIEVKDGKIKKSDVKKVLANKTFSSDEAKKLILEGNLPENATVRGGLDLGGEYITSLPKGLKVEGALDLDYADGIVSLPAGLYAEELSLRGTEITTLPKDLSVLHLYLHGSNVHTLPEGFKVQGNFQVGSKIKALPKGLEVGGYLDLRNTNITSLPEALEIGVYLDLRGTKITTLPADLKTGEYTNYADVFMDKFEGEKPKGVKGNIIVNNKVVASTKRLSTALVEMGSDINPMRDELITALKRIVGVAVIEADFDGIDIAAKKITGYHNCRTFVQTLTGLSNIEARPAVKTPQVGDILWWGRQNKYTHVAVYAGDHKVWQVPEWGASPEKKNLADVVKEWGKPVKYLKGGKIVAEIFEGEKPKEVKGNIRVFAFK
jgi:hypothetical protein